MAQYSYAKIKMADIKIEPRIDIEELINAIRARPCLYDVSLRDYRDNGRKDKAWKAIEKQFSYPVEDLKKQWKSLRDKLQRERNKMNSASSGSGASDDTSSWEYFDAMGFIIPQMKKRTSSNLKMSRKSLSVDIEDSQPVQRICNAELSETDNDTEQILLEENWSQHFPQSITPSSTESTLPGLDSWENDTQVRNPALRSTTAEQAIIAHLDGVKRRCLMSQAKPEPDQVYYFCQMLAPSLRKLTSDRFLACGQKLMQVVMDELDQQRNGK